MRVFVVPEVLVSKVVPSDEVTMVPEPPTPTNNPLEVVVVVVPSSEVVVVEDELSVDADEPPSSLPQEIMVRLKRSTNKMCKILFIFSLH